MPKKRLTASVAAAVLLGGLITATSAPSASAAACAAAWSSTAEYWGGDVVSYAGHNWYAKWWTQGETPGTTGEWGVWSDQGACGAVGTVYFQNVGTVQGWSNYPQSPQKDGVLRNVSSPSYKGGNAIEAQQTYINETGGYHSETVQAHTQEVGQDRYYGQAIYIAPDWQFHDQNVTFQQWSPEDPEGPWELMYIQNDEIRLGGSGGFSAVLGKITDLRGTWIRIVTRLKFDATNGAFEVWINGTRVWTKSGTVLPKTSNSIRWSSGIYCTAWRTGTPAGPWVLSIFHDHARIADTYALAEPANW